jgi:TRAP-type mannitol/chloroaromatic compound transport system permease small subunit
MHHSILTGIDRVSFAAAAAAMVMILGLVASLVYEVGARYLFDAPTIWAYDVSYMLNGSLFILAAAFTLAKNNHVRIDFLSSRLRPRTQHTINLVFYVVLFLPALGFATWSAIIAAWNTLISGEVEAVSPWAPVIWPFNSAIAIGFSALWLQALAEAVRHAIGMSDPDAVPAPNASLPH